jgi:hypothetical protein
MSFGPGVPSGARALSPSVLSSTRASSSSVRKQHVLMLGSLLFAWGCGDDRIVTEYQQVVREHEDTTDQEGAGSVFDGGRVVDAGERMPDRAPTEPAEGDSGAVPIDGGSGESELDATTVSDAGSNEEEPPREREPEEGEDAGGGRPREPELRADAGSDGEPSEPASFTRVYEIFRSQCRGCHAGASQFSLDLSTRALAYAELVAGPNHGAAEFITCSGQGRVRVVPGHPEQSLLIQKLEDQAPCGDQMPPGKQISASMLREVRSWVTAGALDD